MFARDIVHFAIPSTRIRYLVTGLLVALTAMGVQRSRADGETDLRVDNARFHVEIAETAQERQQGLMFRTHLPAERGMLFIQPEATPAAFWMKNTYIPLDLLYFDSAGRLLEIHADVPPCTTPSCPAYVSNGPIKYILEINAGSARRLGLQPGARLHWEH
jgi:uncharacterized membrane protein (UPF0127 family)